MTTAVLRSLFAELCEGLAPLVAGAASDGPAPPGGAFGGPHEVEHQRRAVMDVLEGVGFDPDGWRLDVAPHPFAQRIAPGDVRITTRYDLHDFSGAYFGSLHEFGHGLYEAGIPDRLSRSPLGSPVSLGVHESQSRLWENLVGRSRPFCAWALPRLAANLPGLPDGTTVDDLYRGVNAVHRSLIRVESDETTYNLHIVLRFELELALIEGTLSVDDLPHAWNEGIRRLLGLDVPDDAQGVLQDVHWGAGLIGYFPTYTLGNLMAAQLWETLRADLPEIDAQLERGDFAPLHGWLRERIHVHGRKLPPPELLRPRRRARSSRWRRSCATCGRSSRTPARSQQRLVEVADHAPLVLVRELVDRLGVLRAGQVPVLDRAVCRLLVEHVEVAFLQFRRRDQQGR